MKIIASYLGGSAAYGLFNPLTSDKDVRFVFLNDEIKNILGINRFDHETKINKDEDSAGFEIRHFLRLAQKSNTQIMEAMFNKVWVEKSADFDLIQDNKYKLTSSNNLFKCLRGYIQGEKSIIVGKNNGKLGDKRKKQLEKYGYAVSNCCHAIRLIRSGIIFFRDNIYPVNIVEEDKEYGEMIKHLKFNPASYQVENLLKLIDDLEVKLVESFESRGINHVFNEELANELCYDLYMPILKNYK